MGTHVIFDLSLSVALAFVWALCISTNVMHVCQDVFAFIYLKKHPTKVD